MRNNMMMEFIGHNDNDMMMLSQDMNSLVIRHYKLAIH